MALHPSPGLQIAHQAPAHLWNLPTNCTCLGPRLTKANEASYQACARSRPSHYFKYWSFLAMLNNEPSPVSPQMVVFALKKVQNPQMQKYVWQCMTSGTHLSGGWGLQETLQLASDLGDLGCRCYGFSSAFEQPNWKELQLNWSASSYWGNAELPNIHPDQGLRRNSSLADSSQWIQDDLRDLFRGNVRKPWILTPCMIM